MTATLLWHQVRLEQRAFWRNPQSAFFTFAMPVGLLVIFGFIAHRLPGSGAVRPQVLLVPGFLAFGLIVAAYANLAATITFLRDEGVLKRIRSTPLPPMTYITAQLLSTAVSAFLLTLTCIAFGWVVFGVSPLAGRSLLFALVVLLGVACFASLGLAITRAIKRADAAGPVTNATYIPLAIISGTFSDNLTLPHWLNHVAGLLPIKAFTDALRAGYNPAFHGSVAGDLAVLAVWGAAGVLLTRRFFRWEA